MIDFIIRDCGHGEFLPIIVVTETGKELYRGNRMRSAGEALERAETCWHENGTGNIVQFKQEHGL